MYNIELMQSLYGVQMFKVLSNWLHFSDLETGIQSLVRSKYLHEQFTSIFSLVLRNTNCIQDLSPWSKIMLLAVSNKLEKVEENHGFGQIIKKQFGSSFFLFSGCICNNSNQKTVSQKCGIKPETYQFLNCAVMKKKRKLDQIVSQFYKLLQIQTDLVIQN